MPYRPWCQNIAAPVPALRRNRSGSVCLKMLDRFQYFNHVDALADDVDNVVPRLVRHRSFVRRLLVDGCRVDSAISRRYSSRFRPSFAAVRDMIRPAALYSAIRASLFPEYSSFPLFRSIAGRWYRPATCFPRLCEPEWITGYPVPSEAWSISIKWFPPPGAPRLRSRRFQFL